jgi:hypothetical protein
VRLSRQSSKRSLADGLGNTREFRALKSNSGVAVLNAARLRNRGNKNVSRDTKKPMLSVLPQGKPVRLSVAASRQIFMAGLTQELNYYFVGWQSKEA